MTLQTIRNTVTYSVATYFEEVRLSYWGNIPQTYKLKQIFKYFIDTNLYKIFKLNMIVSSSSKWLNSVYNIPVQENSDYLLRRQQLPFNLLEIIFTERTDF